MTDQPDTSDAELVSVSVLDDNDVFVGTAAINPENVDARHHLPEVPSCDLPPGKYKWNREKKTFEPLLPLGTRNTDRLLNSPATVTAIVKGFEAAHKAGVAMPPETMALVDAHNTMLAGKK